MYQVIIVFHVLLGLGIIGLVLMQQGKGADAGAAFGAGASGSVFGAQGAASFLSRTTAILATLFFTTSLSLAVYNSHTGAAYDLMSGTESVKEVSTLPDVDSPKKAETASSIPVINPEETPVPSDTKVNEIAVPKAEETKTPAADSKKVEPPAAVAPPAKKEAEKK